MSFMKPQIYQGRYFQVNTSAGLETVPCDVVGSRGLARPDDMLAFLEGVPDDPSETIQSEYGWIARMSAPGYMDCTDWTAHKTWGAASRYLSDTYGDEEDSDPDDDTGNAHPADALAMADSEGGECD